MRPLSKLGDEPPSEDAPGLPDQPWGFLFRNNRTEKEKAAVFFAAALALPTPPDDQLG